MKRPPPQILSLSVSRINNTGNIYTYIKVNLQYVRYNDVVKFFFTFQCL